MHLNRPASRPLLVFIVLFAALVLYGYSPWGLWETDEGRYADVARSMLERGDFITPRINGVVFLDKPPLVYWTTAASLALFGNRESWARFPQLLFAGGTLLVIHRIGVLLYDRRRALITTLVLATSVGFFAGSHILTLDLALTFFVALTLLAFLKATRETAASHRWYLLMFAASAGGMLTKGLIGVLLPCMTIASYLTFRGEWRRMREIPWFMGTLLFAVIATPWYLAVSMANPEFPRYFFLHEHLARFATGVHGREGGWLYYLGAMGVGFFPWCMASPLFLIRTGRRDTLLVSRPRSEGSALILSWLIPGLLFFTIARSKLPLYVLPLYPAAALALAAPLGRHSRAEEGSRRLLWWLAVGPMVLIAGAAILWIRSREEIVAIRADASASLVASVAGLVAIAAIACVILVRSGRPLAGLGALGGLSTVAAYVVLTVIGAQNFHNETRYFAKVLGEEMRQGERVFAYRCYLRGLPFYLSSTVGVVAHDSDDIEIGRSFAHDSGSFVSDADLLDALKGDARTFVVLRRPRLLGLQRRIGRPLYVLARSELHDLVSNRLSDHAESEISRELGSAHIDLAAAMSRASEMLPGGEVEMIEIERAPDLDLVLGVESRGSLFDVRFPLTGGRQATVSPEEESSEETGSEEHLLRLVASSRNGPQPPSRFFLTTPETASDRLVVGD